MSTLVTLTSLLLSTTLLLVGHGMHLTLLPLRASAVGQSETLVALGGSAYFAGFVIGCLAAPRIIARAGHIRSFAVLASVMTAGLLVLGLVDHWIAWLLLRAAIGIAICSLYTVIESWLNDQSDASNRGKVLSVYTFLVLTGMAVGQLLVNASPLESATPFMLVAMIIALSVIPVGMTRRLAPAPLAPTRVSFRRLYQRSHTAFVGALLAGIVSGSFWSLGALFAQRSLGSVAETTLFMTLAIVGGALCQYPFGWISDRIGRPRIIVGLCALGALSCAAVALANNPTLLLIAIFAFGATTMPLYSMSLANAADHSQRHEFVEIGSTVLLLNGLGAVVAPLLFGRLMTMAGPPALFWGCAVACLATGIYALARLRRREPASDPSPFAPAASAAAPASFELDPRAPAAGDEAADTGASEPAGDAGEHAPGADADVVEASAEPLEGVLERAADRPGDKPPD